MSINDQLKRKDKYATEFVKEQIAAEYTKKDKDMQELIITGQVEEKANELKDFAKSTGKKSVEVLFKTGKSVKLTDITEDFKKLSKYFSNNIEVKLDVKVDENLKDKEKIIRIK